MQTQASIDVIILSFAKSDSLKLLTEQSIQSCLESELTSEIKLNIIVIESNKQLKPFNFANTTTIYPDQDFGFHRYLNIGIKEGTSPYVCLCNNDLIFHKGWASELLKVFEADKTIFSANPRCDRFIPHQALSKNSPPIIATKNNIFKGILTGWCIFTRRSLYEKIGLLDEQFDFWYADRDYGKTLLKHKIKHVLVPSSTVTHLENQSHDTLAESSKYDEFTIAQKAKYEKKWGSDHSIFSKIIAKIKQNINNA